VINSFPVEKSIVQKEQASNSYHLSAYYLSKVEAELPINLISPVVFSTILFWLTAFNHEVKRYFIFMGVICAEALGAVAIGTAISALAPNVEVASALR